MEHHLVYGPFPLDEWAAGEEEVVPSGGVAFSRLHGPPPFHVEVGVVFLEIVVGGLQGFSIDLRRVEGVRLIILVVGKKMYRHGLAFR